MEESKKKNRAESILIIDDQPENLHLLVDILQHYGYEVRPVRSGSMALQSAQVSPPNLILLDIMMPDMDGYQVCQALKTNERTRHIPVIFMSALDDTFDKVAAFEAGGLDYIAKPFEWKEVVMRVRTHLTLATAQEKLSHQNYRLQQEIQERKQMEAQLRQLNHELTATVEALSASNEELDAFTRTMAHDLKNPLAAVKGWAEVLEEAYDRLPPDRRKKTLRRMVEATDNMNSIIHAMLMLASIHRSGFVKMAPLDMVPILWSVQYNLDSLINDFGATLTVPQHWPTALGHIQWVEEVWTNYISNAIKYGGRPPQVAVGADELPTQMIRFWVRDNGDGLSAIQRTQIFTPFTRLTSVKGKKKQGLGLSIVQRIIAKLGGTVGVESEVGKGSLFFFTLPAIPRVETEQS